jgi:hypothetical protein
MTKIAGSGSISQRHGSADPDPDPHHKMSCIRSTGHKEKWEGNVQIYVCIRIRIHTAKCHGSGTLVIRNTGYKEHWL